MYVPETKTHFSDSFLNVEKQQVEAKQIVPLSSPSQIALHSSPEETRDKQRIDSANAALMAEFKHIQSKIGNHPFVIEKNQVNALTKELGLTNHQLLQKLIPSAKEYASPSISNFRVSIAGLGESGKIYLGVNLEFLGFPLHQTVHGEQFLISLAREQHEKKLVAIALSAEPCGFCRQFIQELGDDCKDLLLLIPNKEPILFPRLLPEAFEPKNLNIQGGLLTSNIELQKSQLESPLTAAIEAARLSYAPYTLSPSGVALETADGKIYTGSYLENVAYNPSLSPLQAALVSLIANGRHYKEISRAVLAELPLPKAKVSQALLTKALIENISPKAVFQVHFNDS